MSRRVPVFVPVVLALLAGVMAAVPSSAASGNEDPTAAANRSLRADAHGRINVRRDASGRVRFVGTAAHAAFDTPGVSPSDTVRSAARAQFNRYGAAVGAAPGSSFADRAPITRDDSGVDVVRYQQSVAGVPVLGGQVVLGLGPDRGLRSLSARVASGVVVKAEAVGSDPAGRTALAVVGRSHPGAHLRVTDLGRWVLDPAVAGIRVPGGARTVRRLEVGDGSGIRELVLVDDQTGAVVFRTSLVENIDRVICDRANVRGAESACTSGFARTENDPATGVSDVNNAFDFAGATSAFYGQIDPTIPDLTTMLGVNVGGTAKLASTVRFCTTSSSDPCPFPNAFWDGTQMFYGQGYAAADDVVGHEMTHGVIDHYSALFYWGQSGAINESLADIMGEIIDHRQQLPGDAANWDLGEDLPGGALRNMADPTISYGGQPGQPDKMTSSLYTADPGYADSGGVHTNSGVGTKTAYLISQGGTFNGQTIAGIDSGDPLLTKTAELYVAVIQNLRSGSDYADLADVLEQTCSNLVASGKLGASDCDSVHKATLATELRTTPTAAAQPADAPVTCSADSTKRVLFDGEAVPASGWTADAGWVRAQAAGGRNATSGTSSWYAVDPATVQTQVLKPTTPITLPVGQPSYLSFQGWNVFDYDSSHYYDGGTVDLATSGSGTVQAEAGSWYSSTGLTVDSTGPTRPLATSFGNPAGGRLAFAGDSQGWVRSRLDLTPYAGQQVQPRFSMQSDSSFGFVGWYLDDVTVYTCDPRLPSVPRAVSVTGILNGARISWAVPATNPDRVIGYQVGGWGGSVNLPATARTYVVRGLPPSMSGFQAVVSATAPGYGSPPATVTVRRAEITLGAVRSGGFVTLRGRATRSFGGVLSGLLKLQRFSQGRWVTVTDVRIRRDGSYVVTVKRFVVSSYRVLFPGAVRVIGSVSVTRRR